MTKEEMIQVVMDTMRKLYYEDAEFFYKFITGYAAKKGIRT